jgi:hypothetical protein
MLFLLPQGFFQRVGVRLVDLIGDVFANPGAGVVQLERRIFLRYLLDAHEYFHKVFGFHLWGSCALWI